jgi:hypothetical protein
MLLFNQSGTETHSKVQVQRARGSISSFDNHLFGSRVPDHFDTSSDEDDDFEPPSYGISHIKQRHLNSLSSRVGSGRTAKRIPYELFELEDKLSGKVLDFNIYNDSDLPFLNDTKNEACNMMRKNIIVGEVDDDCQTDEDQRANAKNMLKDELKNAVNKFLSDKRDGTVEYNIKNFNLKKRFSREPFNLPCTE